jgi:hypothetical protein
MNGREVWKRLAPLALGEAPLPQLSQAELERLKAQYGWTLSPINQDEFPVRHVEGEVTALPIEDLRHKTSCELIAFVMSPPEELIARRTGDRYATFGKLVKEQPSKVVRDRCCALATQRYP